MGETNTVLKMTTHNRNYAIRYLSIYIQQRIWYSLVAAQRGIQSQGCFRWAAYRSAIRRDLVRWRVAANDRQKSRRRDFRCRKLGRSGKQQLKKLVRWSPLNVSGQVQILLPANYRVFCNDGILTHLRYISWTYAYLWLNGLDTDRQLCLLRKTSSNYMLK